MNQRITRKMRNQYLYYAQTPQGTRKAYKTTIGMIQKNEMSPPQSQKKSLTFYGWNCVIYQCWKIELTQYAHQKMSACRK